MYSSVFNFLKAMFYSTDLLGKKSPLGIIWMAAHKSGKLSKSKILSVDLGAVCEKILKPDVPLSLRLTGILVEGTVIVFSKKVEFLVNDSLKTMVRSRLQNVKSVSC